MTDIDFPYGVSPTGRSAAPPTEAAHIRDLIEQAIFTIPGERVMRPDFGTPIRELVFEGASDALADAVKALVHGALQRWLAGRVVVEAVEAEARDATLTVTVAYRLPGSDQPVDVVEVRSGP